MNDSDLRVPALVSAPMSSSDDEGVNFLRILRDELRCRVFARA
jgi:hypothetical protein